MKCYISYTQSVICFCLISGKGLPEKIETIDFVDKLILCYFIYFFALTMFIFLFFQVGSYAFIQIRVSTALKMILKRSILLRF